MEFVPKEEWPATRGAANRTVHPSMYEAVGAIISGSRIKLTDKDRETAGYKTLETMEQTLRKLAADRKCRISSYPRRVLTGTNVIVKPEDMDGLDPDDWEDVLFITKRA